jgi:uncharacterized protein (TIGR00251 family)
MQPPFAVAAGGLTVSLRVTPRARRERIEGIVEDAGRGTALKVAVTAPPDGGKANAAVIALLAKAWRVPKSSIEIVRGASDRRKVVRIAGDGAALAERIAAWLKEHEHA